MPLETGNTISDLNVLWPLDTDVVLQGDDHLRLIKSILLSQFVADGNGLDLPVLANAEEMNFLQGVSSNIQDQLDALDAILESGTTMVFYQAVAPTGWTQVVADVDDKMLRVVSGAGGAFAGNDLVTDWDDHTHEGGDHTLLTAEMPAHGHFVQDDESAVQVQDTPVVAGNLGAGFTGTTDLVNLQRTKDEGGDGAHSHGDSVSSSFDPAYLDVIIATRD